MTSRNVRRKKNIKKLLARPVQGKKSVVSIPFSYSLAKSTNVKLVHEARKNAVMLVGMDDKRFTLFEEE
jgi:hypothetical protein